jgi:hypothetical protein
MVKNGILLSLLILFLAFTQAESQNFSALKWHKGWAVTSDQDTIRGEIMYDMGADAIKVNMGDVVMTYSSRKLLFFTIFDEDLQNYRQFYSLPFNVTFDYKSPILFEVLYEGPLTLLIREAIVEETVPAMYGYQTIGGNGTRYRLVYTYYFLDKNGNVNQFNGKKRELLDMLGKQSNKVSQFMKENKLKPDRMQDLVRITAFYNSII